MGLEKYFVAVAGHGLDTPALPPPLWDSNWLIARSGYVQDWTVEHDKSTQKRNRCWINAWPRRSLRVLGTRELDMCWGHFLEARPGCVSGLVLQALPVQTFCMCVRWKARTRSKDVETLSRDYQRSIPLTTEMGDRET